MADLSVTPVATGIKPVQGMSLADMANVARSAQAYQQSEQMNPLALQKAKADVQTAETGAQSSAIDLANKQVLGIATRLTGLINNPLVIAAEQNPQSVDPAKLADLMKGYGAEQAGALGIHPEKAGALIQPYIDQTQNPAGVRQFLKEKLLATVDQASKINTLGGIGVSTQPAAPAGAGAGAAAPAIGGGPVGAGAQVAPGMRVPYSVRSAAQPYIPEPTESKDLAAGEAYRTSLINRQGKLSTDRRNVEEALAQTKSLESQLFRKEGGLLQDIERKMRMAVNSDEYKMLSKDLANLQITNMNTLGAVGNTVAGIDLTRVANGDETIPPKVLTKIIRRTQADMTNIDMQATGAQKFYQQFGDNNMKAFQQAWNANADSRIFEGMNIIRDEQDPQERQKKLEELFPTAAKRKTFLKKYKNIKSMSETGVPIEQLTDEDR